MRSLIRPTLFMMARLGLLFSLIAFAFGQTWHGVGYIYKLAGAIDRAGIVIMIDLTTRGNWGMQETANKDLVKELLIGDCVEAGNTHLSFSGVAIQYGANGYALGAYHLLVVTVAALFYGVLTVYRKPKQGLINDE